MIPLKLPSSENETKNITFKNLLSVAQTTPDSKRLLIIIILLTILVVFEIMIGVFFKNIHIITEAFQNILHLLAFYFSLYALIISKQPCDFEYTFGYTRIETVSAFSNCIFLSFVAMFLVFRNFHHFFEEHGEAGHLTDSKEEQKIHYYILCGNLVSLLINLLGMKLFWMYAMFIPLEKLSDITGLNNLDGPEGSQLMRKKVSSKRDSEGDALQVQHSLTNLIKSMEEYGNSTFSHYRRKTHNYYENLRFSSHFENLHSVFLHFLIDVLCNVGVLLSFGLREFNPHYFELFFSVLIFFITIIAIKNIIISTGRVLLQALPIKDEKCITNILNEIRYIDGVIDVEEKNFWGVSCGYLVCTLRVKIRKEMDWQSMLEAVQDVLKHKFSNTCVEFVKE